MVETKQDVFEFGRQLISTEDLDPVYSLLWEGRNHFKGGKLADWLVAYWCFYHCGTAAWIIAHGPSSGDGYWAALEEAANSAKHPRGTERRHFRGQNGIKAVRGLRSHGLTCDELIEGLRGGVEEPTLETVTGRVTEWGGFGPWIAFKVADMIERLGIFPVSFSPMDVFKMFDAPRKGAELMAEKYGPHRGSTPYLWAYNQIIRQLGTLKAPPRFERRINIQEVETVLCKWKSHMNGHYPPGNDIEEIHKGLLRYQDCTYASVMLASGQRLGWWEELR